MSVTAQPTLLLENNSLFRAPASAFNRVLQRELTILQATTAMGLESISGWRRSSCRCCRSPIDTRMCVCVCTQHARATTRCNSSHVTPGGPPPSCPEHKINFFLRLGYAFPVYPPYPGLKVSAQTSSVTTNRTITMELRVTSGPWFREGGTHILARGNRRLWVLAPALQNQGLKEKCHWEPTGRSHPTRKLSPVSFPHCESAVLSQGPLTALLAR